MNHSEVRKPNDEIAVKNPNIGYFKDLYQQCKKARELVPEKFVKDIYEEALLDEKCVKMICFSQSFKGGITVSFFVCDPISGDIESKEYTVKDVNYDFQEFYVAIDLAEKNNQDTMELNWDPVGTNFSCAIAKEIFGRQYLTGSDDDCKIKVSTSDFK